MLKTVALLNMFLEIFFRILWWICSKEQLLFEIEFFPNILNGFAVKTIKLLNASLIKLFLVNKQ